MSDRKKTSPNGRTSETASLVSIRTAAQRAALDLHVVEYCVEVGLVEDNLSETDLCELRRVRRLMSLGVNLHGVEIIMRMRRRIQELEAELARLQSGLRW